MKKALYSLLIVATTMTIASCSSKEDSKNETIIETREGIAEDTKVLVQPQESMVKEVVEGTQGKPITIETKKGKMHGQIEFPGAITLTNLKEVKNIIYKLTPAQGQNTYKCAVVFTGTPKKGKIWNFTKKPITVDVKWEYEDGTTSTETISVESQKFSFTYADEKKGETKTITYNVIEQQ